MMSDGMMHCFRNLEAMGMEDLIYMMLNTLVTKHNTVEHPIATRPCYKKPAGDHGRECVREIFLEMQTGDVQSGKTRPNQDYF